MNDWKLAQRDHSEQLAKLHFFSFTKKHAAGEIEAHIMVKKFASAKTSDMQFFAQADIELNQKAMSWHETLFGALADCLRHLRKFEYEGVEAECSPAAD